MPDTNDEATRAPLEGEVVAPAEIVSMPKPEEVLGDASTKTSALAVVSKGDSTALDTRIDYTPALSAFVQAFQNWMISKRIKSIAELLHDPHGCGLQGRIDFDSKPLKLFLEDQYSAFWKVFETVTPEAASSLHRFSEDLESFFTNAALTHLQSVLITRIQDGAIPHPDGKQIGTDRAWMPGSAEDDCRRALGSLRYNTANYLKENLGHYSSGKLENDQALIQEMSRYIGLYPEAASSLQARVLDHYGLPNSHKARNTYGALLYTALGQVFGRENKQTTAEKIIEDQIEKYKWPEEYKKPPLLDVVLELALESYNPTSVESSWRDMAERIPDIDEAEISKRVAEAHTISNALHAFRAKMLGIDEVLMPEA